MLEFNRSLPMMLYRALDTIMPRFRKVFHEFGLTETQWRVLRVLWEQERIPVRELSKTTLIPAPSLVGVIDRRDVQRRRRQQLGHALLHRRVLVNHEHLRADELAHAGHQTAAADFGRHGHGALNTNGQTNAISSAPGDGNCQLSIKPVTQSASWSEPVVFATGRTLDAWPSGMMTNWTSTLPSRGFDSEADLAARW